MRYAASRRNWVVRFMTPKQLSMNAIASDLASGEHIDGVIFSSLFGCEFMRFADSHPGIPMVRLDIPSDCATRSSVATVMIDNSEIGRQAARLLLRKGLRHLAFVDNINIFEDIHQTGRRDAFREAALETGASFTEFVVSRELVADDMEELADWLSRLPLPCGILAYNDSRAQTIIDACHLARLDIPEQIQIVGVDNDEMICESTFPTLTSIQPDFERGGYMAAQLLDGLLSSDAAPQPAERTYGIKAVVERASTQDAKGGARLVTQAMEFMRINFASRIDVASVAAALGVSRRTIEKRFREVRGEGVGMALRRIRLDNVRRLLRETDRPIYTIANECGFDSPIYLMSLFKRTFGSTMGDFRSPPPPKNREGGRPRVEKRGGGNVS